MLCSYHPPKPSSRSKSLPASGEGKPLLKGVFGPGAIGALLDDAEGSLLKAGRGCGETPGKGLFQSLHAALTVLCQFLKSASERALLRYLVPEVGWGCIHLAEVGVGALTCWFLQCCPGE